MRGLWLISARRFLWCAILAAGLAGSGNLVTLAQAQESTPQPGAQPETPDSGTGAQVEDEEPPIRLIAREAGFDDKLGLFVARGDVEILREDKIVMADTVTYNERTKRIIASGNVKIIDSNGDIQFANYADVTDDVKEGILYDFRMLLAADRTDAPNARIAANEAHRIENDTKEVLDKVVYTPCLPCKEDPTRTPLWQVKAQHAVRDKVAQTVTYEDAWIEMFGVPFIYTPWFRHPDFGVNRQSGFLSPSFHFSSKSGAQFQVPYFWVIGPDQDMTFSPIFRVGGEVEEDPGVVGVVEYRHRIENGLYRIAGSMTVEDREPDARHTDEDVIERDFRGHAEGEGLFDLDEDWRWGFDFKAVTDKDYLRKYHLGSRDAILEDKLYTEGFFGRSYAQARSYAFQSTVDSRQDDRLPFIVPILDYNFVGEPSKAGAYFGVNANLLNLRRIDRRDSFRIAASPYWTLPYTSSFGDQYRLTLSVPMTLHVVHDQDPSAEDDDVDGCSSTQEADPDETCEDYDGTKARALPKLSFDWSYPFVSPDPEFSQVLEPIIQLVAAPDWGNTDKIPNEDSRAFELDDTRILSSDRFAGYDRMDAGSRATYGLDWYGYLQEGGEYNVFLGQSYQFTHDQNDEFRQGTGIEEDLTDIVGRLQANPTQELDIGYRFRFDAKDLNFNRHEAGFGYVTDPFAVNLDYTYIDGDDSEFGNREQIASNMSADLSDYWTATLRSTYDLTDSELLRVGGGLRYLDECFEFNVTSDYTPNGTTVESEGDFRLMLTVDFRTLGGVDVPF